jgi:Flp pilus assembly protein TadD
MLVRSFLLCLLTSLAFSAHAATSVPSHAQVMAVPDELRERVRVEVGRELPPLRRAERLAHFLFDADGLGLTYDAEATGSVEDAYATRRVNCLTFTLVFVSLARELDLEAYGQAVDNVLLWHESEAIVYRTDHVNAGVAIGGRRFVSDVARDTVSLGRSTAPINDARLLALYYNNRAVQLHAAGQVAAAMQHVEASLGLDPAYPTSWSNAGALRMRHGDTRAAERNYRRALELDPDHPPTLFNLASYEQRRGNDERASVYRRRLDAVQERDPYHHFQRAVEHETHGRYPQAVHRYRRAIALHPDEHRFHFGLTRAYERLGKTAAAEKALTRAFELSRGSDQGRYSAKLEKLRGEL